MKRKRSSNQPKQKNYKIPDVVFVQRGLLGYFKQRLTRQEWKIFSRKKRSSLSHEVAKRV